MFESTARMTEAESIDHLLLPLDQAHQFPPLDPQNRPRGLRRARPPPLESLNRTREPLSPASPTTPTRESSKRWGFKVKSSKSSKQLGLGPISSASYPNSPSHQRSIYGAGNRKSFMSTKNLRSSYLPSLNSPLPPLSPVTPSLDIPHLVPKASIPIMRSKSPAVPSRPRPVHSMSSTAWEPPPLFQAFPQAQKHGCLETSAISADLILRLESNKRLSNERTEMLRSSIEAGPTKTRRADKKEAKLRKQYRDKASKLATKAEWVRKVYVLVTSGHLLQYAGDGEYDRLPEESLQLGHDSVAFVSDAIPGKHWVLQVSQSADEDGHVAVENSKSFISMFSFKKSETRPPTTSFLMIFSSGEDMEGWMLAIRREIETRGGKKYGADAVGRSSGDFDKTRLRSIPSQRYLIQRDPNLFAGALDDPWDEEADSNHKDEDEEEEEEVDEIPLVNVSSTAARRQSFRPSFETPSISNSTVVSTDQVQLENLREGSRLSYMSSGAWTNATSQDSSPGLSPENDQCMESEDEPSRQSPIDGLANASMADRRKSMLAGYGSRTDQGQLLEQQKPFKPLRPHSTFGPSDAQSRSPSTPNFSFPQASKRISMSRGPITTTSSSRQPNIPALLAEKESTEELKSRPTSTLGELPSRDALKWSRPSKLYEEAASADISSSQAGLVKRPMSPEEFYPKRLSHLPSLSTPKQLDDPLDTAITSLSRSNSRSSISATQRNWPFKPSQSELEDIVLDPPPQRHGATPRSQTPTSGWPTRPESEHSHCHSTISDPPSSASFHTAASLPRSITQPLRPAPAIPSFEEPSSFAWPPKPFSQPQPLASITASTSLTPASNPSGHVLRRPHSMQVRAAPVSLPALSIPQPRALQTSAWLDELSIKPPPRRPEDRIRKRKSMPVILAGPPPAPPPNCPLPQVPADL